MSLFRISLFCAGYCLLALGILPTQTLAQGNRNYPNTGAVGFGASGDAELGVASPSFPNTQTPGFVDRSSVSPDSWSAPPTNSVRQPELMASATELPPALATTTFESNSFEHSLNPQAATSVSTKAPSIPNLKSDSPLLIRKTDANSPRVASLQSRYSQLPLARHPYQQQLAFPLQSAGPGGAAVVNPPLYYALPSQNLVNQNPIYSLTPQALANQPNFVRQTAPQMLPPSPVGAGASSYSPQQVNPGPAFRGAYPGSPGLQNPQLQW